MHKIGTWVQNPPNKEKNAWLTHYKILKNKVLPVVVGIDKNVCMLLVADNILGNIRLSIEGGIHTSSWDEEYIIRKDIYNG